MSARGLVGCLNLGPMLVISDALTEPGKCLFDCRCSEIDTCCGEKCTKLILRFIKSQLPSLRCFVFSTKRPHLEPKLLKLCRISFKLGPLFTSSQVIFEFYLSIILASTELD